MSLVGEQLQLVMNNLNNNGLLDVRSLISRYYGGVYFSYKQAVQIDLILEAISAYIKRIIETYSLSCIVKHSQ